MYLMNTDIPVVWFDFSTYQVRVLNNDMLPYALRNCLVDTTDQMLPSEIARIVDSLRLFFAGRVLLLSRENAKQILNAISFTQHLTTEESCKLSLACRGVSISDNFWVREDNEEISFEEVNVRNNSLSKVVQQLSLKGTPISIQKKYLVPDLTTSGLFPKTWVREDGTLYLIKTDKLNLKLNVKAELTVSDILEQLGVYHVTYEQYKFDNTLCTKCKCFTNDQYSFVEAEQVQQYCMHIGVSFNDFVKERFLTEFADMVVSDYLIANTDRHSGNWGFMVDNRTNEIVSFAPLFDYNLAMIALWNHKEAEFDELIYEPTGLSCRESMLAYYSQCSFRDAVLTGEIEQRFVSVKDMYNEYCMLGKHKGLRDLARKGFELLDKHEL